MFGNPVIWLPTAGKLPLVISIFRKKHLKQYIQWNSVNAVTIGPKEFGRINGVAVLTRFFFYKKMYGGFLTGAPKKVAVITR